MPLSVKWSGWDPLSSQYFLRSLKEKLYKLATQHSTSSTPACLFCLQLPVSLVYQQFCHEGRRKANFSLYFSLSSSKSSLPVSSPALQQTPCYSPLLALSESPVDHTDLPSKLLSTQLQQAFPENTQTTTTREAGRLTADLHLSIFSFKSKPPSLKPITCCSLPLLSALIQSIRQLCSKLPAISPWTATDIPWEPISQACQNDK